ncbi:MAG TPA: hypothetical protein VHK70_11195 [Burkholderiaceae bacterium]|nr:hypothetical protein [Burkholderiaceae bacterium]
MAEAEDVLTDAARHAVIFARDIWRRSHPLAPARTIALADVAPRLGFLAAAVFGTAPPLRVAQAPAPATFLQYLRDRHAGPSHRAALPATDGRTIWLPRELDTEDMAAALQRYRVLTLQQAMRVTRGSVRQIEPHAVPLLRDVYLLLEAAAADFALAAWLPGMRAAIGILRHDALRRRPPLDAFPAPRRRIEALVRNFLQRDCASAPDGIDLAQPSSGIYRQAQEIADRLAEPRQRAPKGGLLFKDAWTGEFRLPVAGEPSVADGRAEQDAEGEGRPSRSAHLERTPEVRRPNADEDDDRQGAWMVQTTQPQEHAEDPVGMQRPTDRDETTAAEEFADSLAELPEARLVSAPGRPKEVLLSDDAPDGLGRKLPAAPLRQTAGIAYPEWDYRARQYREAGVMVRLHAPAPGPEEWVAATLARHGAMLNVIRRHFETLRANRVRLRKQLDGEEPDLDAYIDGCADFRAGRSLPQSLYQSYRPIRRDMAIMLLTDISGSTDAWISAHRRVIDVEREALLLVCIALEGLGEPYAVQAFSGEGPGHVVVREVKSFEERYHHDVGCRIAALEPERYTRTGAAMRHAAATLMRQPARHRLLLLLSDGKPNDSDEYEGRYGIEDLRQAVIEADWQGISPFCLTIDRLAAAYLPQVFGARRYALLPKPELLPTVLLDWMRRLAAG